MRTNSAVAAVAAVVVGFVLFTPPPVVAETPAVRPPNPHKWGNQKELLATINGASVARSPFESPRLRGLGGQSALPQTDPAAVIRLRLRQSLLPDTLTPKMIADAEAVLQTMRPDGSWADQNYADTDREVWKAGAHLGRVLTIARAYYAPGSTLAKKPEVAERIVASLGYWLKADPKNDNWWHNMIGVPLQVGDLLILMGNDAPPDLRDQGVKLMTRGTMEKMTGQNLVWGAEIQILRGILGETPALIGSAYERMWQEVVVANIGQEGIQSDASFHQHGPLLYAGGYGAGFVSDTVRFVGYAAETPYAIPGEKKAILDRYVLDGVQWMLRDGQWDYGATGRELIRPGKSAAPMVRPVVALAAMPGPRQAEMRIFADRISGKPGAKPLIGNRHYWRSDYMAHQRPGYFAATRMDSVRTANTDGLTNGENKKSHHLADGALYLSTDGGEYTGIYPVWEWHQIPGTTAEQNTVLDPKKVRRMGATKFDGGVSDGLYGAAAMDLSVGELKAQKAWFYFDREIVCLGAGIDCTSANPVATSINQCLLRGPVQMSDSAASQTVPRGERSLTNAKWVWHDHMGYVFPAATDLRLKNDSQTGSFREIGPGPETPITKDVFRLSMDHGVGPKNAGYAYIVVPAATAEQTAATAAKLPLEIVSNTATLQAVWHKERKILAVAFRAPGQVSAGGQAVSVDQPCLLLLRQEGGKWKLAVSNPENLPRTVTVRVGKKTVKVALPDGLRAGESIVQDL
jgi:chondroitin AC lyase